MRATLLCCGSQGCTPQVGSVLWSQAAQLGEVLGPYMAWEQARRLFREGHGQRLGNTLHHLQYHEGLKARHGSRLWLLKW